MAPSAVQDQKKPTPAWKSPWVIGWIALVVAVLAVNFTMVYLAIATNPGLVTEDFYDRGQDYEETMVSKMARDPGWYLYADVPSDLAADRPSVIRFFITDKAGQPVTPEKVHFYAYRPSDATQDFDLPMVREGNGRFKVDVTFPLLGAWDTLVAVQHGEDEYNLGKRIRVGRP
jgi:nitrogen fixation protein FixH